MVSKITESFLGFKILNRVEEKNITIRINLFIILLNEKNTRV